MSIVRVRDCANQPVLYCLLFTAKNGCDAIKTNAICKHLKAFPSLQLGDRKNPQVI